MKTILVTLAAGALLALPSTAAAQFGPTPALDTAYCDQLRPEVCVTPQAGDYVRVVLDGDQQTGWQVDRYLFADIPTPNKLRVAYTGIITFDAFGRTGAMTLAQPQDHLLDSYCWAYVSQTRFTEPDYPAKVDTPASVYEACHYTRHENEPAPQLTSTPITEQPIKETLQKAQACAAVPVGRSKVTVAATGVGCYSARGIIARYVKSGVEPEGFVCVTAAVGRSRAATCASKGRAAARRIVGKWRR